MPKRGALTQEQALDVITDGVSEWVRMLREC